MKETTFRDGMRYGFYGAVISLAIVCINLVHNKINSYEKTRLPVLQGELLRDYIQNEGTNNELYRINFHTTQGAGTFPVLGTPRELRALEGKFISREESGLQGDILSIDPNSNVFSLDEIILLPKHIKLVKPAKFK